MPYNDKKKVTYAERRMMMIMAKSSSHIIACNKDIEFLSQTVDEITHEKDMWKEKFESERVCKLQLYTRRVISTNIVMHVDQQ